MTQEPKEPTPQEEPITPGEPLRPDPGRPQTRGGTFKGERDGRIPEAKPTR
jgi:hypothetical protein